MKILVSSCLLGANCKYSGENNICQCVCDLGKKHTLLSICPELMAGLPTPRLPAELCNGVIYDSSHSNVYNIYRIGALRALQIALQEEVDIAILQSRSPTCGVHQIYDGSFSGKLISGEGIFATLLKDNGIPTIDVEDFINNNFEFKNRESI